MPVRWTLWEILKAYSVCLDEVYKREQNLLKFFLSLRHDLTKNDFHDIFGEPEILRLLQPTKEDTENLIP